MDDSSDITSLALELSDLEVALFLCLAVHEHCRIEATDANIHDVAKELALICTNTFGLSYTILDCSSATSYDDFCAELLPPDIVKGHVRPSRSRMTTESSVTLSSMQDSRDLRGRFRSATIEPKREIVNVVIAKNFNHVNDDIQRQALELMHSKRLATQAGILEAPAEFLFVPLTVRTAKQNQNQTGLNPHLNDYIFISHFHDTEDGFAYLEENADWLSDGQMSASSVIRKLETPIKKSHPGIDRQTLDHLQQLSNAVTVGADIARYQQDITVFLRLSRAVSGGISTRSNLHFKAFSKLLAVLHGIDYLTPSIVALAAKKVFRHRIIVASPEEDRSLQYGSDFKAVSQVLEYANPDSILDGVLTLEAPL
ncbi:hypothetical protein BO70DRAFT_185534 [Aspergillus heteromorphus CBS 117.55]|uniref:magnesium chelatase n=1 Tax=Aspergillus heteromorphus CBS 117.55 TaxID=1448321 RepID=A0A317UU67_9EURO|nr:uncharacterized protein BO70DRAFT_185534 [Aspergillus heteromorphus CBS 117.55]PWY65574.1 hypothetical protein BO70DRAFT_185534 [Aspergillus heteromorphus CBS 117.55]